MGRVCRRPSRTRPPHPATQSRHIRYDVCFSAADRARLPRSARLARLAAIVTALTGGSGAAFAASLASGSTALAALHPPALYAGLAAAAAAPLHVGPAPAARMLFAATAARVATPYRPVTWSDFLLADVATSLAAPLAGGARAVCHAVTAGVLAPPDEPAGSLCGKAGPVVLAAAAAPFAARFAQCVRVWSDTGASPQLWNALKYATAFPALLAAAGYERAREAAAAGGGGGGGGAAVAAQSAAATALAAWVACQLLNTCFSYFWDVERDWEIQWFTRVGRPKGGGGGGPTPPSGRRWWASALVPPPPALPPARTLESERTYHWLMASNAALRLAWLARTPWAPGWARAPLAPAVAGVLEAARRAQWYVVGREGAQGGGRCVRACVLLPLSSLPCTPHLSPPSLSHHTFHARHNKTGSPSGWRWNCARCRRPARTWASWSRRGSQGRGRLGGEGGSTRHGGCRRGRGGRCCR